MITNPNKAICQKSWIQKFPLLYERVCCIVRTTGTGTNPRRSGKGGRGGRRLGGGGRNKVRTDIGDASDDNDSGDELEDEDGDDGFDLPPMEEITGECECVCSMFWMFFISNN